MSKNSKAPAASLSVDPDSPIPGTVETVTADPFAHVADPHWGQGGSFVVVNGQRVPAAAVSNATPVTEAEHG